MERLASDDKPGDPSTAVTTRTPCSLQKIPLPTFGGQHKDWPSFKGLFRSLVIRESTLSDAERLHYLRGALTGDAALLLRNMPESEENFEAAWALVQERYENKRLMVKAQLNTIFILPTLTRESGTELKRLFYTVCDTVKALASMKRPFDASGDWLIHLIVERIDPQTRREWETLIGKTKTPPTFFELQEFLEGRVNTLEALEEERKGPKNQIAKPATYQKSAKAHQVSQVKPQPDPCSICKGNHFILYCPVYKAKTVAERRAALQTAGLCYNCLGKHHVRDCNSARRCQKCNGKHHTTIHEEIEDRTFDQEFTAKTSSCVSTAVPAVLLATARVKVLQQDGGSRLVRALVDQDSEVSLITEALARQLRLPRKSARINLVGVGSPQPERISGKVQLELSAHFNSTDRHVIVALVLPRITSYQPRIASRVDAWDHLKGLTLADPGFNAEGPIDLLLGADALALVLRDGIARGRSSEPIAKQTTLGWIISGPATPNAGSEAVGRRGVSALSCSTEEDLLPLVQRFWEQEEIAVSSTYTTEEQYLSLVPRYSHL